MAEAVEEAGREARTRTRAGVWPRVGDLVAVRRVRPVVQMADLQDGGLRRQLAEQFVLTAEAEHALSTVLRDMASGRGRGYFIEGGYGAGKSHLLAAVHLLLSPGGGLPAETATRLPDGTPSVVPIAVSLVEHAADEPLEGIVGERVAAALGLADTPRARAGARLDLWRAVAERLTGTRRAGLALLIDELSEFLRSKRDGRALNEDMRFLQFLGESAERLPAWVLCTTQEAVEDAADLPPAAAARLRDRYPVRFRLGGTHVKEIVARRLLVRQAGADAALGGVFATLRNRFGGLAFTESEFLQLYPLHPATIDALDELRPLFSQQRGVVDFVSAQLAGDPARRIPPWTEQPADRLICPDALWLHFRDRLRDQPATNRLAVEAVPRLEREVARLFPEPAVRPAARRLVHLLALGAAGPQAHGWSARQAADLLLHPVTDLDPAVNLAFVEDLLRRLADDGSYVVADPAGQPHARRYRLDAAADTGMVLQRRLASLRDDLLPADGRMFHLLVPWCDDPLFPLASLCQAPCVAYNVHWLGGPRQVWVRHGRVADMDAGGLRAALEEQEAGEADVGVFVAHAYPGEAAAARRRWRELLAAASPEARRCLVLWLARDPIPVERDLLRESVARARLAAEIPEDRSTANERLRERVGQQLPGWRRDVARLYRQLYLEGELLGPDGVRRPPAALGAGDFAALLERIAAGPLRARYPRFREVATNPALTTPAAVAQALEALQSGGESRPTKDPALGGAFEGVLLPLGLARRTARGFQLRLGSDAGEPASELIACVGAASPAAPATVAGTYRALRRGPFGLPRESFEVLAVTLVRAGTLAGCRAGRRVPAGQVTTSTLWDLDGFAAGERLSPQRQAVLRELPFLAPPVRGAPLTLGLQREAWRAVIGWSRDWSAGLREMRQLLVSVQGFPSLRTLRRVDAEADIRHVEALVQAVQPTLRPQPGLERFLDAWQATPAASEALNRCERLRRFLATRLDSILFLMHYLEGAAAPSEAWEAQRVALLGLAKDAAPQLSDDGWATLEQGFASFRAGFANTYLRAHEAAVGAAALAPYAAIRAGDDHAVAAALSAVPGLVASPDLVSLQRRVDAALATRCAREPAEVAETLQRLPACACGFRPGREPEREPVPVLEQAAAATAAAYLEAVRQPAWAERVRAYAGAVAAAGRPAESAAVAELLTLPPGESSARQTMARLLTGPLGRELVAALAGRAVVVERDLDRLAAALAGRTLSRRQVREAVTAWLGRTDAGVYVHVRGPGTALGVAAGGLGPVPAAGLEPPSAGMPASGPPRRPAQAQRLPVADRPGGATGGGAAQDAGSSGDAARRLRANLSASLERLRRAADRPPDDARGWEELFADVAHCERWITEFREAGRAGGADGPGVPEGWLREWRAAGADLRDRFRRFVAQGRDVGAPEAGAGRPARGLTLPRVVGAWRSRRGDWGPAGGAAFCWCVDALRADLLPPLLATLAPAAEVLEAGLLWARLPTVTRVQFDALRAAGFTGPVAAWNEAQLDALLSGAEAWRAIDWASGLETVCRWEFLDRRVHAAREDFGALLAEFRLHAGRLLLPALRALPPGALLLLFGDHGFIENPASRSDALPGQPRFVHGGCSPEEVLAPWAVLRRAATQQAPSGPAGPGSAAVRRPPARVGPGYAQLAGQRAVPVQLLGVGQPAAATGGRQHEVGHAPHRGVGLRTVADGMT